jgi:hypothetical protein
VQPRFTPETGAPLFALGGLSAVLNTALGSDGSGRIDAAALRRVQGIGGMQRMQYDSSTRQWRGSVDDLYRFDQGRFVVRPGGADTTTPPAPFTVDRHWGLVRQLALGTANGARGAWLRYPERRLVVLVLTGADAANGSATAGAMAQQLADRLIAP